MNEGLYGEERNLQGAGPLDKKTGRRLNVDAHYRADTDESRDSIHHTLGDGPQQAAAGNHNHDTLYRPRLTEAMTLTHTNMALANNAFTKITAWTTASSMGNAIENLGAGDIKIWEAGWYSIKQRLFYNSGTGVRAGRILIGGGAVDQMNVPCYTGAEVSTINLWEGLIGASVNVTTDAFQNSGASLNTLASILIIRKISESS